MKTPIVIIIPSSGSDTLFRRNQSLGVAYIAAYLENHGYSCDCIDIESNTDLNNKQHVEYLLERIIRYGYIICGISCLSHSYQAVLRFLCELKTRQPDIVTFLGNHHASALDMEIIDKYPQVDLVVRGEGEVTVLKLVDAILHGRNYTNLEGITWRDSQRRAIRNAQRPAIDDLDSLPFPKRVTDLSLYTQTFDVKRKKYKYNFSVISSRGCPYQCSFCVIPNYARMQKKKWRARSAANIILEVKSLLKLTDNLCIKFSDDNFLVDFERALTIAEELSTLNGGNIIFTFASRADQIIKFGSENLNKMKKYGCTSIELGIESGCDSALMRFNKGVTAADNELAIQMVKEANIVCGTSFILFDPDTTYEELLQNALFIKRNKMINSYYPIVFNRLEPYPGSDVYEQNVIDEVAYFHDYTVEIIYGYMKEYESKFMRQIDQLVDYLYRKESTLLPDYYDLALDKLALFHAPYRFLFQILQYDAAKITTLNIYEMSSYKQTENLIRIIRDKYNIVVTAN